MREAEGGRRESVGYAGRDVGHVLGVGRDGPGVPQERRHEVVHDYLL